MTRRVVIDTSSLISAAIRPETIPAQALQKALGTAQICTSGQHMAELEKVLRKPRFDNYVALDARLKLFETVRLHATHFDVQEAIMQMFAGICRDANDQFLLALAVVAEASIIVSSDYDLLTLNPWRGIAILTPAQFLAASNAS